MLQLRRHPSRRRATASSKAAPRKAASGKGKAAPSRSLILRTGIAALMVACGLAAADLADAQQPTTPKDPPVLLNADSVTYDQDLGVVTASGNVELSKGPRNVRADTITYNEKSKVVTATGHVRLVEPSGDIMFADYAELTDDLKNAFVDNLRILMTDNSRMAGNEGERVAGSLTRVSRAVYSPCELCKEDPTRSPIWQVRAVRVVHDADAKEVRYKDAVLEMYGIPFFYTPYLSHPDPTVKRASGFLTPSFRNSSELGFGLLLHYYWDIAPDQDATIDFGDYTAQGPVVGGQYRKRFENGSLQLDGAVAEGKIPNGSSGQKDRRLRGYAFAKGLFDINDTWRWGFDLKRSSDQYFLRRYYDIKDDYLTSKAFIEGFNGRNYAGLTTYSFQDLRWGNTVPEPLAQVATYNALGEPGQLWGGRWSLNSSLLSVSRFGKDGPNTQRVSAQPGWEREIISNAGFVTTLSANVLMAGYTEQQFDPLDTTSPGHDSTSRTRFFPSGQATVRYPFVRYGEHSQQSIEPTVQLTVAPKVNNDSTYPNEDSLDVQLNEINLFMPNRFTGIDRLDGGSRITYGLRAAIEGYKTGAASAFVGQSYRFTKSNEFMNGSGLEDHRSDYVGSLDLTPADWLDLNYGFRIDQESLIARRHSLTASAGVPWFRPSFTYTYVNQTGDTSSSTLDKVEQANFGLSSRLDNYWTLSIAHQQAMSQSPGPRASAAVLTYQDECFTFQTIAQRDYTTTANTNSTEGNTIFFRFVFKNLGEVRTPGISASFLSAGGSSTSN